MSQLQILNDDGDLGTDYTNRTRTPEYGLSPEAASHGNADAARGGQDLPLADREAQSSDEKIALLKGMSEFSGSWGSNPEDEYFEGLF